MFHLCCLLKIILKRYLYEIIDLKIYRQSDPLPHLERMYKTALLLIRTTFILNGYYDPEDVTFFGISTLERMYDMASHSHYCTEYET